jgi:hypothetical protein
MGHRVFFVVLDTLTDAAVSRAEVVQGLLE